MKVSSVRAGLENLSVSHLSEAPNLIRFGEPTAVVLRAGPEGCGVREFL